MAKEVVVITDQNLIVKYYVWTQLAKNLKQVKTDEMKLRKEIAAEVLLGQTLPVNKRFSFKGVIADVINDISYNLDDSLINQIYKELTDAEKISLNFKPALKLREYKKLPKEALLHEAITTKPSAPTIKVIE